MAVWAKRVPAVSAGSQPTVSRISYQPAVRNVSVPSTTSIPAVAVSGARNLRGCRVCGATAWGSAAKVMSGSISVPERGYETDGSSGHKRDGEPTQRVGEPPVGVVTHQVSITGNEHDVGKERPRR